MEVVHLYSLYLVEHQPDMFLTYPPLSLQYCRPVFVHLWLSQRFHKVVCKSKYLVRRTHMRYPIGNRTTEGRATRFGKRAIFFGNFPVWQRIIQVDAPLNRDCTSVQHPFKGEPTWVMISCCSALAVATPKKIWF